MTPDITFKKQEKSQFEGILLANDLSADSLLYLFDFALGRMKEIKHNLRFLHPLNRVAPMN